MVRAALIRAAAAGIGLWVMCTLGPVACLRVVDPPTSALMVRERLSALRRGDDSRLHHHWVPLEQIAPELALAVIAAEDQKFPDHRGFDLQAIADALGERGEGRLRGASTLSQQVTKNLFLWPERSLVRKGIEAYLTVLVELCWPKRRILEVYLNIAEFGDRVYGAGAASQRFFGKPAAALSGREAALLAAVLPSPRRMRADAPSAYVRERSQRIQLQMEQLGGVGFLARLSR